LSARFVVSRRVHVAQVLLQLPHPSPHTCQILYVREAFAYNQRLDIVSQTKVSVAFLRETDLAAHCRNQDANGVRYAHRSVAEDARAEVLGKQLQQADHVVLGNNVLVPDDGFHQVYAFCDDYDHEREDRGAGVAEAQVLCYTVVGMETGGHPCCSCRYRCKPNPL
jgi:hypothetical protein